MVSGAVGLRFPGFDAARLQRIRKHGGVCETARCIEYSVRGAGWGGTELGAVEPGFAS